MLLDANIHIEIEAHEHSNELSNWCAGPHRTGVAGRAWTPQRLPFSDVRYHPREHPNSDRVRELTLIEELGPLACEAYAQ